MGIPGDTANFLLSDIDQLPVTDVAVTDLRVGDSPRVEGEHLDHVRELAEIFDQLPPILVHRPTMKIIDGMHRFRAALTLKKTRITARFIDIDESDAFIIAVQANITGGLPLSAAEKRESARRIITSHPDRSDRWIAATCGISRSKIAKLRVCPTGIPLQLDKRIGRDGKTRPTNPEVGRKKARDYIEGHPKATIREIAEEADISPETARKIRIAMKADPYQKGDHPPTVENAAPQPALQKLRGDPAIRSNEVARKLIRSIDTLAALARDPSKITNSIPEYAIPLVTEALIQSSNACQSITNQIDRTTSS